MRGRVKRVQILPTGSQTGKIQVRVQFWGLGASLNGSERKRLSLSHFEIGSRIQVLGSSSRLSLAFCFPLLVFWMGKEKKENSEGRKRNSFIGSKDLEGFRAKRKSKKRDKVIIVWTEKGERES